MKFSSTFVFSSLFTFLLIGIMSFTTRPNSSAAEEDAVKELILKSYVHGAFNELSPDAMLKGFHADFAIFSAKGEEISKYPIATWAEGVRKKKSDPEFNPKENMWKHKFASVDVTGGSAAVKIQLHHQGKHVYTDYLSLLKFESGWKIVAKVYHKHEN